MRRILICFLLIFFPVFSGFLFSQVKTVAVLNLEGKGISDIEAGTLTDRLIGELFKTGQFNVMERQKLDRILTEQGFQQTACTTAECAVEIGKLAGVSAIIVGSVGRIGKIYTLSVRMINVETGGIIQTANEDTEGPIENLLLVSVPNVAAKLSGVSQSAQTAKPLQPTTPSPAKPETPAPSVRPQIAGQYFAEGRITLLSGVEIKGNNMAIEGENITIYSGGMKLSYNLNDVRKAEAKKGTKVTTGAVVGFAGVGGCCLLSNLANQSASGLPTDQIFLGSCCWGGIGGLIGAGIGYFIPSYEVVYQK